MNRDLEVRHCRVLVAVADQGGVAAAARALGLSQSTVSETLLALERVVGASVTLRRPGREATLTPSAEALLPHARALIAASEAALAVFSDRDQGAIRLGTVESISSFLLPEPLQAFRGVRPRVDVRITIGLCEDLRRRVRGGELDAALTIEGAPSGPHPDGARILAPSQLKLLVTPGHPLAGAEVTRAELASRTLLFADPDGAFNRLLAIWFAGHAQAPRFDSAGSIEGVRRGVRSGDTIGVLPAYAVAEDLASGALVALKTREPLPPIALMLTTLEPASEASALNDLMSTVGEAFGAA